MGWRPQCFRRTGCFRRRVLRAKKRPVPECYVMLQLLRFRPPFTSQEDVVGWWDLAWVHS